MYSKAFRITYRLVERWNWIQTDSQSDAQTKEKRPNSHSKLQTDSQKDKGKQTSRQADKNIIKLAERHPDR